MAMSGQYRHILFAYYWGIGHRDLPASLAPETHRQIITPYKISAYGATRHSVGRSQYHADLATFGRADVRTFALSEAQPKSNLWMHQEDFHVTKGS
jgi:hypothetical protein